MGAQGFAQVAQALLRKLVTGCTAFALIACAPPIREHGVAVKTADALLPSGRNLFLFDFAQSRYQKWPMPEGTPLGVCALGDTLKGGWSAPANWLAIPSPVQPFMPMEAIWGPNGNFFLLDRAQKRLCLYDTGAQFLSGFPLPQEIREKNLEDFEVFWTRDGLFSFVDAGEGKVWQYAEIRSSGGSGDWQLRNTIRLPVGLEACLWEPFLRNPCCLRGRSHSPSQSGNAGENQAVCFDKYFNPMGGWNRAASAEGFRVEPVSGESSWRLILDLGPGCGSDSRFCYSPDKGGFLPCSDPTRPASGPIPPEP